MGQFIWHQWAPFVSITASCYAMWSAYWGIFYRMVFWSFVGGHLRAPGGLQPSASLMPFVSIIVKAPVVQAITMVLSAAILALELVPAAKQSSLGRSWVVKGMLLLVQALLANLYYQGTNAAIWSIMAAFGYAQAQMKGEEAEEAKQNRGKVGDA